MDLEQLSKYFSEEMSPKEKEEFISGLLDDPAQLDEFSQLKNIWTLTRIQAGNADKKMVKKEWRTFAKRTLHNGKRQIWRRVAWAATVLLLIGITGVISFFQGQHSIEVPPVAYTTLSVPAGQYAQATLPDGSEIWLNSRSSITYPDRFDSKMREVHLVGEGFFKVASDIEHPFIVKTKNIDIVATGTQFNVSAYDNDQWVSTSLVEGKVNLFSEQNNVNHQLHEGQLAVYNKEQNKIVLKVSDAESEISWIKGEFRFKEMDFENITKRLERNFNVHFVFKDHSIKKRQFTGTFYNHQSVENILKALKTSTKQMYYTIEKDTIFIGNK